MITRIPENNQVQNHLTSGLKIFNNNQDKIIFYKPEHTWTGGGRVYLKSGAKPWLTLEPDSLYSCDIKDGGIILIKEEFTWSKSNRKGIKRNLKDPSDIRDYLELPVPDADLYLLECIHPLEKNRPSAVPFFNVHHREELVGYAGLILTS